MNALSDLRASIRSLRRAPVFVVTVVLCWGLAFAANATMMAIADEVFLQPPRHVRAPSEVVRLYQVSRLADAREVLSGAFAFSTVKALVARAPSVGEVAAYGTVDATLSLAGGGRTIRAGIASDNLFRLLGVRAAVGMSPGGFSFESGSVDFAALSFELWRSAFAGDSSVLGRTVLVHDQPFVVAAVLPQGFNAGAPNRVDVWVPLRVAGQWMGPKWRESRVGWLSVLARVKPGHAGGEFASVAARVFRDERAGDLRTEIIDNALAASIVPGRGPIRTPQHKTILWLTGAAATLLMLATLSVSVLLLLRALQNWRELAIRRSLGAGMQALASRVGTEALVLGCAAGVAGGLTVVVLKASTQRLLGMDLFGSAWWRIALIELGAMIVASLLATAAPMVTIALNRGAAGGLGTQATATRSSGRLRNALVAVEVACAVMLVTGAILLGRSLHAIRAQDLGLDPGHIIVIGIDPEYARANGSSVGLTLEAMEDRVRGMAGVVTAAQSVGAPFQGAMGSAAYDDEQRLLLTPNNKTPFYNAVSASYMRTLGARFKEGRDFTESDEVSRAPVAIVNESFARLSESARVGRCIYVGDLQSPCYRIVGIVRDLRRFSVMPEPAGMEIYVISSMNRLAKFAPSRTLLIRTGESAEKMSPLIERVVRPLAPTSAAITVQSMTESMDPQVRPWLAATRLVRAYASVALLIALVGVFGTLGYLAKLAARETAIRLALGATRDRIAISSARLGVILGSVGSAVATIAVFVVAGRLAVALFGVTRAEVQLTVLASAIAVTASCAAASIVPVWREAGQPLARILRGD